MRRGVAVLLVMASAVALATVGLGPTSAAAATPGPFPDVAADHPFVDDITWMVTEGIADGYADGTFRPAAPITRQAMAAFLYRSAGSPAGPDPTCASAPFPDVPVTHVFCGEIDWLVTEGITTGYADGTFRPADVITRQAMAAFLHRSAGSPAGPDPTCSSAPFPDVPVTHVFCGEIDWLVTEGIADGYADGTFRPAAPITRQAMAAFLHRLSLWEPPPGDPVTWRFVPGAVLLEPGETAEVQLVGRDAAGRDTPGPPPAFELTSSPSSLAALDAAEDGTVTVTAGAELGVGLTTADVEGLVTEPLTVTVAQVAPGVVKVSDSQILYPPAEDGDVAGVDASGVGPFTWAEVTERTVAGNAADPGTDPVSYLSSGSRLAYVLAGEAPEVGTVLVGSGGASLMGRVVSPPATPNLTRTWGDGPFSLVSIELVPFPVAFTAVAADLASDDLEAVGAPFDLGGELCDPATDPTCDPTPVIVPGDPVVEPYTGPTADDPDGSGGSTPPPTVGLGAVAPASGSTRAETEFEVAGMTCKASPSLSPANIKLESFSPNFTAYLVLKVDVNPDVSPYVRFEGGGRAAPMATFSVNLQATLSGSLECEVGHGLKYVTPLKGPWGLLAPAVRLVPTIEGSLSLTGGPSLRTDFTMHGDLRVHAGFAYDPTNRYGQNTEGAFRPIHLIDGPHFEMTPTLARLDVGLGDGSPWTLEATGGGYLKLAAGIQLGGEILEKYLKATGQAQLAEELFSELANFKAGIRARATYDSDGVVLNSKATNSFVGVESDLKITVAPQIVNDILAVLTNGSVSFSLVIPVPSPVKLPLFQPVVMKPPVVTVDGVQRDAANLEVTSGQVIGIKVEQDMAKTFSATGTLVDGSVWEPGTISHVRSDVVDLTANPGSTPFLDGSIAVTAERCEQWREPTPYKMLALTRVDVAVGSLDTPSWAGELTVTCVDPGLHFDPPSLSASGDSTLKATGLPSSNRDWQLTSSLPPWLHVSGTSGTFAAADDSEVLTFTIDEPTVTCETGPVTLTTVVVASAGELAGTPLEATLNVSQVFDVPPECIPPPPAGPGGAWGDPHMVTLDGLPYEGQVFGEYVYLEPRDLGDGLRVHARHEATSAAMLNGSLATSVTAVAVEVDGHVVEAYLRPDEAYYLDGVAWAPVDGAPTEIAPGVSVSRVGNTVSVNTPTQNVRLDAILGLDIFNVWITVPADGALQGMLGIPDGDVGNDRTRRDGVAEAELATLDAIHRFTDSWWIGDLADSLLTSEPIADRFPGAERYAHPVTPEELAPTVAEVAAAIQPVVCSTDGPGAANYDALVQKLALDRYVWGADLGDLTAYACTYTVEGTASLDFDTGGAPLPMTGLELTVEAPGLTPCTTTAHATGGYTCALRPAPGVTEAPTLPLEATVTARWPGDATPVGTATATFDSLAPFMAGLTATADVAVDPASLVVLDLGGIAVRDGVPYDGPVAVTVDVDLPDTDPLHRFHQIIQTAPDGTYRLVLVAPRTVTAADVELRIEDDGWPAFFTTSVTGLTTGVNVIPLDAIYDRVALHLSGDIVKDGLPVPGPFFLAVHSYSGPYSILFDTTYITSVGYGLVADAAGHYDVTVHLPPATRMAGLRIDVGGESFPMEHVPLVPGPNDVVFDVDASQPTLALSGTVVKDGAPWTTPFSLTVYAYKAAPAGGDPVLFWSSFHSVSPDAAGQWALDEVLPHETVFVKVRLIADSTTRWAEAPVSVGVNPLVVDVDLTPPTVGLQGTLTRNGQALQQNLPLVLLPYVHTPGGSPEWFALDPIEVAPDTDVDGHFAIDVDLPTAANHVVVSTDLVGVLHQVAVDVVPGANPVTFDIADDRPVLAVSGTIIDQFGPVVDPVDVSVAAYRHGDLPEDPPVDLGFSSTSAVLPDGSGAYQLDGVVLPPETELALVSATVDGTAFEQWVDVVVGDNATVFDMDAAQRFLDVSGTVVKNGEGVNQPVTVQITALHDPGNGDPLEVVSDTGVQVLPVDGAYELLGHVLPPATDQVDVAIAIAGEGDAVTVDVLGPGTTTAVLDIDVQTVVFRLQGKMLLDGGAPFTGPVHVLSWPDDNTPANPELEPFAVQFDVLPEADGSYLFEVDMPPTTTRTGVSVSANPSFGIGTAFDTSPGLNWYGIDWTFPRARVTAEGSVTVDGLDYTGPLTIEVTSDLDGVPPDVYEVSWDGGLGAYTLDEPLPFGTSSAVVRLTIDTGTLTCGIDYDLPSIDWFGSNLVSFTWDVVTSDEATCVPHG